MSSLIPVYVEFFLQFFSIFSIFVIIIQLIALVLKTKDYTLELLILGLLSFCILMLFYEFSELTTTSAKLSYQEMPEIASVFNKMFALMASTLIFGVAIVKNRLEHIEIKLKK